MIKIRTTISNKLGLHARASAKLTKLAGSFTSEIHLSRNGRRVNAKSIMGVMMLAAGMGSEIEIETDGVDEQQRGRRDLRADRSEVRRGRLNDGRPRRSAGCAGRCATVGGCANPQGTECRVVMARSCRCSALRRAWVVDRNAPS